MANENPDYDGSAMEKFMFGPMRAASDIPPTDEGYDGTLESMEQYLMEQGDDDDRQVVVMIVFNKGIHKNHVTTLTSKLSDIIEYMQMTAFRPTKQEPTLVMEAVKNE
jgi:hypothetical protein